METVKVKPHQCLGDLALQGKGSMQALFDFAVVNNCSITDDLVAGNTLLVPDIAVIDKRIFQQLRDAAVIPANGFTAADEAAMKGGIGYMGIQIDCRVS
ncbi:hypothetical protein [Chitinophaga nivalis]|uniref:Uncharacterized protein n=1 Tax=Chitinophaga nivalis TaxID=2991709 RepID=A0ABT3IFC6_9BACT|nr:hypothetical protein [Chitinophaga nivalis]MCW3467645.1 hypothetical protein [Chitinophaga nivalis]MCW3482663.1 hypothetical protein [Chitinophaga nivalis]